MSPISTPTWRMALLLVGVLQEMPTMVCSVSASSSLTSTRRASTSPIASPSVFYDATNPPLLPVLSAGAFHTCALLYNGSMKCWGQSSYGAIGYNLSTDVLTPAAVGYVSVGGAVAQVAGGYSHTCVLLVDGSVKCWGYAGLYQTGYGNTETTYAPPAGYVNLGGPVMQITAGYSFTCALLVSGSMSCFGDNGYGQLGIGNTVSNTIPTTISLEANVTNIVAGGYHICTVNANGLVKCWGRGSGGNADVYAPPLTYVPVAGTVVQMAAGQYHTCVVLTTGLLQCWGYNMNGQLGLGDTTGRSFPRTVSVGGNVTQVTAGRLHTCALLVDGALKCWGYNSYGQLGYGTSTDILAPGGVVPLDGAVSSVTAGYHHTCVVMQYGGVQCFGDGQYGQLGYNNTVETTTSQGNIALPILYPSATTSASTAGTASPCYSAHASLTASATASSPVFPGTPLLPTVCAGGRHTCALLYNGSMKCWGDGMYGAVGANSTVNVLSPGAVAYLPVGGIVTQVAVGFEHTCIIVSNGRVKCWGFSDYYETGYGSNIALLSPPAGYVNIGAAVRQLAAGYHYNCALLFNSSICCWGDNTHGALGVGTTALAYTPAVIRWNANITRITAGGYHMCALLVNAAIQCWGQSDFGQTGYNITSNLLSPPLMYVDVGGPVVQVAAGKYHTCALLVTGALQCWGFNAYGQLGLGHSRNVGVPSNVAVGGNVTQVSAGDSHTCVLLTDGYVKCWGYGSWGQLGYGTTTSILAPGGPVPLDGLVASISAGSRHTCVVMQLGGVQCFGDASAGQLGYNNTIQSATSPGNVNLPIFYAPFPSPSPSVSVTPSPAASASTSPTKSPSTSASMSNRYTPTGSITTTLLQSGSVTVSPSVPPVAAFVPTVCAGGFHTCAAFYNGSMKCWGQGLYSATGYNITSDILTPAAVGFVNVGGLVAQVSLGYTHTCVVLSTGGVKCWGTTASGESGYGTGVSIRSPPAALVNVGGPVKQISTGISYTCALLISGSVACWGSNFYGQLGLNNYVTTPTPTFLAEVYDVTQIATGGYHTCMLIVNGSVKCWGRGSNGQTGYNSTLGTVAPPLAYVNVGGVVKQITAGDFHTCALLVDASVKCWGLNMNGQLGVGNTTDQRTPVHVPIGGNVTQISAGSLHTCVTLTNGSSMCWGSGSYGQLGYGISADLFSPAGPVPLNGTVVSVSAGYRHSCVAMQTGAVQCFGLGASGQLGYNNNASTSSSSGNIDLLIFYPAASPSPAANPTPSSSTSYTSYATSAPTVSSSPARSASVTAYSSLWPKTALLPQVCAGGAHTCAFLNNGSMKCWGQGSFNALGYNSTVDVLSPAAVGFVPVNGTVAQVGTGHTHTCALLLNGSVKCWGASEFGQAGYGSTTMTFSLSSAYVNLGAEAQQIATGDYYTCALLVNGSLACWGDNTYGQLGIGVIVSTNVPILVSSSFLPRANITQVATGGYHTCILIVNGSIICWGRASNGQTGYNTTATIRTPPSAYVNVSGPVKQIAMGQYHTCVLLVNASIACWGLNGNGQLGLKDTLDRLLPVAVPLAGNVTQVSCGGWHTCAVLTNGSLCCWGWSSYGQLGYGNTPDILVPTGMVPLNGRVVSVSAGYQHTCVAMQSGTIQCFGDGSYGQLGYNNQAVVAVSRGDIDFPILYPVTPPSPSPTLAPSTSPSVSPVTVSPSATYTGTLTISPSRSLFFTALPTPYIGTPLMPQISLGSAHTCALLINGSLKCWGEGAYGATGYNTTDDVLTPANVGYVAVGENVVQVTAGFVHTCVLLTNGEVKCWGFNGGGETGYGTTTNNLCPLDAVVNVGLTAIALASGYLHTCALLLNRSVTCWGENAYGQLGLGTTTFAYTPTAINVLDAGNVMQVATGGGHTCILTVNGSVKCWGYAAFGQTGYNTTVSTLEPPLDFVDVGGPVVTLSAGRDHTCALLMDASVSCWGYNFFGQLGLGDTVPRTVPVHVPYAGNVKQVSAGAAHTCVVLTNGSVACWGYGLYGQLGYGTSDDIIAPSGVVPLDGKAVSVSAGVYHTCAVMATGHVQCFGDNTGGELGYNSYVLSYSSQGNVDLPVLYALETPTPTPCVRSPSVSMSPTSFPSFSFTGTSIMSPSPVPPLASVEPVATAAPTELPSIPYSSFMASSPTTTAVVSPLSSSVLESYSSTATPEGDTYSEAISSGHPYARLVDFRADAYNFTESFALTQQLEGAESMGLVTSAGLPPRKFTLTFNGTQLRGLVQISLACASLDGVPVPSEWMTLVEAQSTTSLWMWQSIQLDEINVNSVKTTCDIRVTNSAVSTIIPLRITFLSIPSSWVEIGDLLTLVQDSSGGSGDIIRSMIAGQESAHEIRTSLCCQDSSDCNMTGCDVSNSSTSPILLESAASLFRAQSWSGNKTNPYSQASITVTGNVILSIVSQVFIRTSAGPSVPGPYTNNTRVHVGGVICTSLWVGANGHMLTVRLPSMEDMCPATSGTSDCGYQTLTVVVPSRVGGNLEEAVLGTSVKCPPVCPRALPSNAITLPLPHADGVFLSYANPTGMDGSVVPIPAWQGSSLGLYFTSSCTASGFESLNPRVCINITHPDFSRCPFGSGAACKPCPLGAMCPGGFRAWPLPGYFTPAEPSGILLQCPSPASRCAGWEAAHGYVKCGDGYRHGSYMCTACAANYYARNDGTCGACPADTGKMGIILQTTIFIGILLGAVGVLYGICVGILKLLGGDTHNLAGSFIVLLTWAFATLQTVGQLGKESSAGLPSFVQSMYSALLVFQFEGATLPAACTGASPLHTQVTIAAVVSSAVLLLVLLYVMATCFKVVGAWIQGSVVMKHALKALLLALSLAYAPVLNGLVNVLACTDSSIPVRTYLALEQDGGALVAAGIVLASNPTRAQLDTLMHVQLLASDPSQVCYEALHATAFPLACLTVVLYVLLYPVAMVIYTMGRTADVRVRKPSADTLPYTDSSSVVPVTLAPPCCIYKGGTRPDVLLLGVEAKKRPTRSETMRCAIDENPNKYNDILLCPFIYGQYSPYYVWFMLVDAWLQFGLVAIGILWRYPSPGTSNTGKVAALSVMLVVAAGLFEVNSPFRVGNSWKTHVKALSLLLCALGAIENALLVEGGPTPDGNVSTSVSVCSYILVTGTVVLVLTLFTAFLTSLFAEQQLNSLLPKRKKSKSKARSSKLMAHERRDSLKPIRRVSVMAFQSSPLTSNARTVYKPRASEAALTLQMVDNPLAGVGNVALLTQRNNARQSVANFSPIKAKTTTSKKFAAHPTAMK